MLIKIENMNLDSITFFLLRRTIISIQRLFFCVVFQLYQLSGNDFCLTFICVIGNFVMYWCDVILGDF